MAIFIHSSVASRSRLHYGLWAVAFAFFTVLAFSTVPTPLYALYQARDGFSTFMITVIFAAYALGVIAALFFAGHVSDWFGRRRSLLPAIGFALLSALIFLFWRAAIGLIVARVISGIGVGMMTATATAHIADLDRAHRPDSRSRRAQVLATVANLGGLGAGPLVAGLLVQYGGRPLATPFIVFLVVLAAALVAVAFTPETVTVSSPTPRYRPQRVAVPENARGRYIGAALAGVAAFSVFGLLTALAPSLLAGTLHEHSHLLAGIPAFAAFSAAVVAQLISSGWSLRRQLLLGRLAMIAGVALVVLAVWLPALAPFMVGAVAAGFGAGLLFKGGIATVSQIASKANLAESLAGFFLAAYLGLTVPVLGLGILAQLIALRLALTIFAVLVVAGVIGAVAVAAPRRSASAQRGLPAIGS